MQRGLLAQNLKRLSGLEVVRGAGIRSPALLIVGGVVKLRPQLSWFQPAARAEPELRVGIALARYSLPT